MNLNDYLGKEIKIKIDRPLGSKHPKYDFVYEINYGFVPDTKAPDGEEIDAYLLGVEEPVDEFTGECVSIIHRLNDEDDKLVIAPNGFEFDNQIIRDKTNFQEKYFKSIIIKKGLNV